MLLSKIIYLQQYAQYSNISMGFYTWATHGNQKKRGNWETQKPMSCFLETSQNDKLWKPQKLQKPMETG